MVVWLFVLMESVDIMLYCFWLLCVFNMFLHFSHPVHINMNVD